MAQALAHAATLRGAVVDNQSGRPLARSLVVIQPVAGTAGTVQSTRTNSYGAFEFPPLPAGGYLLSASRRGFAPVKYGQKRWKGSGIPVVLADTTVAILSIRLPRFGSISGTVSDETDVGMPGIPVAIYRNTRPPVLVTKAETDDRGAYRAGGLEPGSYLVRTLAAQDMDASWVPTFSPENTRIDGARPAEVTLDRETTLINLRPIPGRLYTVSGRVVNAQRTGVTLMLTSDMGTEIAAADSAGNFLFKPAAPGPYELAALTAEDRRAGIRAAWMPVQVDRDNDYRVTLGPLTEVRFEVEDSKAQAIHLATVTILARRKDLTGESRPVTLRLNEGRVPMAPGRWQLSLVAGPDQYVAGFTGPSAGTLANRRADGWNEMVLGGAALEVVRFVLAPNPGAVHGTVSNEANSAAAGAPVFLEPFDPETGKRLLEVRMTRADVRGRYQFAGLAPGHYRVMSSYDVDTPDSAMMDAADPKLVKVEEGRDVAADLPLYVAP
jgi:hypothetical protein